MKLTIKCDCGGEYDIEFEPVDGKLPGELICPRCNTDKTDLVNRMIAAQLAASVSTATSQPVATPTPPPPPAEPAPAPRQPLRFKKPGSMLAEPSTPTAVPPPPPSTSPPPPVPPAVPSVSSVPTPAKHGGDLRKALAAYNAGPNAVRRYDGIPPYPETRDYIARVLSRYKSGS